MQFPQGTLFAPYEVLRNTSSRAFQVQLTANYLGQSGPTDVSLGAIMLSPQEVQQVDLKDLLAAAGLGQYNGLINLRTSYVGNHSDLLAEAGSVDQTMSYVFETPPLWEAGSGARILSYWNTNADTDTMITVWNHSSQPEDLILTFYHQQGQYKLPIHLAANGSTSLSVAALIKGSQPDSAGNVIPPTITQGSGKLTSVKGDLKRLNVSLHIGVFNVRTATCTCPCAYCVPYEGESLSPANIAGPIGFSQPFAAYVYLSDGSYDVTSEVDWSSNDTTIAQVTSGSTPATGVGVGHTDIGGGIFEFDNLFDANSGSDCMSGGSFFPSGPQSEQSICGVTSAPPYQMPTTVQPQITSISPTQGAVGTTVPVVIMGSGFGTSPTVDAGAGISVAGCTSGATCTDGEIDTSFAISPSATTGSVTVTVTVTGSDGTTQPATTSFSVVSAIPVNFQQTSESSNSSNGFLTFTYSWASSDGSPAHIALCNVRELVTYPGAPVAYVWATPPYAAFTTTPNPNSTNPGSAMLQAFTDTQRNNGFQTPYQANDFVATQIWQFQCPNYQNNAWVQFAPTPTTSYSIERTVSLVSGSTWKYMVTKAGYSASLNPLP
jgi:hypothetical protein